VDLWRVELHTAHCKCTNHSHGKPKFFSDSVCSACVSEPVWADLNAEASPFPCLPAHVPLNHVYDPSLVESCHHSARSTGFFGPFRRSFTADFRPSSLGKSSSVRFTFILTCWCDREDSNLHPFQDKHLKLARLPISPRSHVSRQTCICLPSPTVQVGTRSTLVDVEGFEPTQTYWHCHSLTTSLSLLGMHIRDIWRTKRRCRVKFHPGFKLGIEPRTLQLQ
jgi:hypothetical protein